MVEWLEDRSQIPFLQPKNFVKMCWNLTLMKVSSQASCSEDTAESHRNLIRTSLGPSCFHVCLLAISHPIPPIIGHPTVMADPWARMQIYTSGVTYPMSYPGPWGMLNAGHSFHFPSKKCQFCRNSVFCWKSILTAMSQRASPVSFMCREMKLITGQSSSSKEDKEM